MLWIVVFQQHIHLKIIDATIYINIIDSLVTYINVLFKLVITYRKGHSFMKHTSWKKTAHPYWITPIANARTPSYFVVGLLKLPSRSIYKQSGAF